MFGRWLGFRDEPVAESHGVSIIDIPFTRDELDEFDSDKYDALVATVDPEMARKYWYTYGVTATVSALSTLLVFLPILGKKTRRNSFNVYLIMLMLPDLYYNGSCAIQCLWNAQLGHMKSVLFCHWQSHMVFFGITSNAWLNFLVARQIHRMLEFTKACRHYEPPSCTTVLLHSCIVYAYALFLSFLPLILSIPIEVGLLMGVGCIPIQYDGLSLLFLYAVLLPMAAGIPMVYVLWAAYDIFHSGLIPRDLGQAKHLLIYFSRIVLVFVFCWFPSIVFLFSFDLGRLWVRLAFSDLAHLQGSIAAAFSLLKPDIWEAFTGLYGCGSCPGIYSCCWRKQPKHNGAEETEADESKSHLPCVNISEDTPAPATRNSWASHPSCAREILVGESLEQDRRSSLDMTRALARDSAPAVGNAANV